MNPLRLILAFLLALPALGQTMLLARNSVFRQPAALTDVALWFRASDLAGADGSSVSTWTARTGQTATQGTGSQQPTLQTSEVNGRSAVQSDQTDDAMSLSAAVSAAGDWTAITVQKRVNSNSLGCIVGSSTLTTMQYRTPYSAFEYGTLSRTYVGSRTDQKYYNGIPSHAYHVLTVRNTSGVLELWIDGVSQSLNAAATSATADFDTLFHRGSGATVEYWGVLAAEVLIWTRALSTDERQSVENWLMSPGEYNLP